MNNLNLFRQSCQSFMFRSFLARPTFGFSEYFRQKDLQDMWDYNDRKVQNKRYKNLVNLWKKPLQKKKLRQTRIKQIKANLPEPQPEAQKLVIHNPAIGIKIPKENELFAVIKVDDRQFKVTNSCLIILDAKPQHQINKKVTFQQVLLVGTQTYTALGRPLVKTAKVEGVIESISKSEKILVFKKKRRKQYKKSFGSRVPLTTCRITSVVHNLTQDILQRAVSLIE